MTSNIHTLSSINRATQACQGLAFSGQHPRIMTLSDLPSQSSNREHDVESQALRHLQEARLSTQEANRKLDHIIERNEKTIRKLDEVVERADKILRGEIDPNKEYTPEQQQQLRQQMAQAEETTRLLKALENELNRSFVSSVVNALKKHISNIATVLKAAVERGRNHQWKTAHKVAAIALITLGLGLAVYRFSPIVVARFR